MYRRNIDIIRPPSKLFVLSVPSSSLVAEFDNLQPAVVQVMEWFQSGIPTVWMKTRKFWYEFIWTEVEHRPEQTHPVEQYIVWVPDSPRRKITDDILLADVTAFGLAWDAATKSPSYPVYYQVSGPDGSYLYTLTAAILQRL